MSRGMGSDRMEVRNEERHPSSGDRGFGPDDSSDSSGPRVRCALCDHSLLPGFGHPQPAGQWQQPLRFVRHLGVLDPWGNQLRNTELEPWVAVNPTNPLNIIGVYQQDRYTFGGARGLAAAVTHNGGATWSSTYPHFSACAGGTEANGG